MQDTLGELGKGVQRGPAAELVPVSGRWEWGVPNPNDLQRVPREASEIAKWTKSMELGVEVGSGVAPGGGRERQSGVPKKVFQLSRQCSCIISIIMLLYLVDKSFVK